MSDWAVTKHFTRAMPHALFLHHDPEAGSDTIPCRIVSPASSGGGRMGCSASEHLVVTLRVFFPGIYAKAVRRWKWLIFKDVNFVTGGFSEARCAVNAISASGKGEPYSYICRVSNSYPDDRCTAL